MRTSHEIRRPVPILFSEKLKEYNFGKDHPFNVDRFDDFPQMLEQYLKNTDYRLVETDPVDEIELRTIANPGYIEFTRQFFNSSEEERSATDFGKYHSQDNLPGRRSGKMETAARLVLGQAKKASDLVVDTDLGAAVSIGGGFHHAKPGSGEGFCLYNDVAFAAKHLLKKREIDRVLILDTDAHFGNGTYEYFSDDSRVLQIDLHQDPSTIYPGTGFVEQVGKANGKGYTINVPMPVKAGDRAYELVFRDIVVPVASQFDPSVIIRNGGADPYVGDPLTNLGVTLGGLNRIGDLTRQLRKDLGSGLVDLLVSGYSGDRLHRSWLSLITGLMGKEIDIDEAHQDDPEEKLPETKVLIQKIQNVHRNYWDF